MLFCLCSFFNIFYCADFYFEEKYCCVSGSKVLPRLMLVLANMLVLLLLWLPVGLCCSLPRSCSFIPTYNFVAGCTQVPCYRRFCTPNPPTSSGSSSASAAAAAWADTSSTTPALTMEVEARWAQTTLDQSPSWEVSAVEYVEKKERWILAIPQEENGARSSTTTKSPGSEKSIQSHDANAPADPLLSFLGVLLAGGIVGSGLFSLW